MERILEIENEILGYIGEYRELAADLPCINDIMYLRKNISVELAFYGAEWGRLKIALSHAKLDLKYKEVNLTMDYKNKGVKVVDIPNFVKANLEEETRSEELLEAQLQASKVFMEVVKNVLDEMNQRVAHLRTEAQQTKNY